MKIERQEDASKGAYSVLLDGNRAELTYSRAGEGLIIIDHTGVPDALRGQGIGEALVERAVSDARAEGRRILPLCPFAKAQIRKHPEWQDVLQ
jgi:predicted GNAT family acetyltransferase